MWVGGGGAGAFAPDLLKFPGESPIHGSMEEPMDLNGIVLAALVELDGQIPEGVQPVTEWGWDA